MIRSIQRFFDTRIRGRLGEEDRESQMRGLQVAAAALLIEVTRADYQVLDAEREAVLKAVRDLFALDAQETEELVALAEEEVRRAVSLYEFTRLINQNFSQEQKQKIIELLWRIAFADDEKDKYEEYLVRKVADLLHVPHREFVRARHRVETELAENPRRHAD